MTKLGNDTIFHIIQRGSAEQRSHLIKNYSLHSEHLIAMSNQASRHDWQRHGKEIMDSGQHIGSHNVQKALVRSSRSTAQRVMAHPEAKYNKLHLQEIHDQLVRNYYRAPEHYKDWHDS